MWRWLITLWTCFFFGAAYGHDILYNPDPMNLTYGGAEGAISIVLVGDEPSPNCTVLAAATIQPGSSTDLLSFTPAGANPSPSPVLNVHVLRQPNGSSESVTVVGSWASTGLPGPPCKKGQSDKKSFTVTVARTETIVTAVVNGASFLPGIQTGSWTTIRGTALAGHARIWDPQFEIVDGTLPTSMDGVSVTINGKAAAIYYISPTQLNVLPADDAALGTVEVRVVAGGGTSNAAVSQLQKYSPAFFMLDPQDRKYIAAQIARPDGGVDLLGPAGLFGSAAPTRPAKPGDVVILYGTGFGPTSPRVPSGKVFTGAAPTADPVVVTIGGVDAKVLFAGISGAGLYQVNVVVPNVADGDQKVVASVGGLSSPADAYIAVKN